MSLLCPSPAASLLLLALTAGFASVPLLVLRSGEVQVVTVALILSIAIVLLRARPVQL